MHKKDKLLFEYTPEHYQYAKHE